MNELLNVVRRNTNYSLKIRECFFFNDYASYINDALCYILANIYRDSINSVIPEGVFVSKE